MLPLRPAREGELYFPEDREVNLVELALVLSPHAIAIAWPVKGVETLKSCPGKKHLLRKKLGENDRCGLTNNCR